MIKESFFLKKVYFKLKGQCNIIICLIYFFFFGVINQDVKCDLDICLLEIEQMLLIYFIQISKQ